MTGTFAVPLSSAACKLQTGDGTRKRGIRFEDELFKRFEKLQKYFLLDSIDVNNDCIGLLDTSIKNK